MPDLSTLFPKSSASFRRLNGASLAPIPCAQGQPASIAVRQSKASGLNKTEARFLAEYLRPLYTNVKPHGLTLALANGVKYTPDFIVQSEGVIRAYEVKAMRGNRVHVEDDASVKIKVAASEWPTIKFIITWWDKSKHAWQFQEVIK